MRPSAGELLAKVVELYRAPQKWLVSGKGLFQPRGTSQAKDVQFQFAIELPDRVRLEGETGVFGITAPESFSVLVADGQGTWVCEPGGKKYFRVARSSPAGSVARTDDQFPDYDRPEQLAAYFYRAATQHYAGLADKERTATVTGTELILRRGKPVECYIVQVDRGAFDKQAPGSSRTTLRVGAARSLVWREDVEAWFAHNQREYSRLDLDVFLDEPLPQEAFVFTQPKNAKLISAPKR